MEIEYDWSPIPGPPCFPFMADFINVNADTTFEPWELCKDQRDLPVSVWGCLISQGLAGNQKPFWTQSGFEGHGIQYRETVLQVTEGLENKRKERLPRH